MEYQSAEIDQLTAALVEVDKEIAPVKKDAKNPFFKNDYATLKAITEAITPILAKHGVKFRCVPDGDHILGKLSHVSGQWEQGRIRLLNGKGDMQGEGSAITYARRYALCSMLNVVADEDDDANAASQPVQQNYSNPKNYKFPFGKHKGKALKDIPKADLVRNVTWMMGDSEKAEKFKELIKVCNEYLQDQKA